MTRDQILKFATAPNPQELFLQAKALRDIGHGHDISFSRKVFIPLTKLCRNVCSYCTFAHPPRRGEFPFLTPDEVLKIARAGKAAGCKEALFTLGDKPELRYEAAREALAKLGHATTISYLTEMCDLVFTETGLLPHSNPGVVSGEEMRDLREFTVSQGLMLENTSSRLTKKGQPHFGSPDKDPDLRLETIREAGRQSIPFTTGILIGIGETWAERIDSLLEIKKTNDEFKHIQEIIIQNFRSKPLTKMENAKEPSLEELMRCIAIARIILGPKMNIQAPPNLSPDTFQMLIEAGINDWGGISPVTPDHVNPEAPWPEILNLSARTAEAGKRLVERLAIYPEYALKPEKWLDTKLQRNVSESVDSSGLVRENSWHPGTAINIPVIPHDSTPGSPYIKTVLEKLRQGAIADRSDIITLFKARGDDFRKVASAADELRKKICGDEISYVVNRNINYTNICGYKCAFCAFSKGKRKPALGEKPYLLDLKEIGYRAQEAWERGATEVCMQGGIHPTFTGETYLKICDTVKTFAPDIHIHAFSPLEISHGANTLGISVEQFICRLKDAGLGSLPGTAAEILDEKIREKICPDKISAAEWLEIIETAHQAGVPSTATIMFGHIETPENWADHLIALRDLQARTGGFTEFVPLPYVHMEAPLYHHGRSRKGPTYRETLLMHAIARLALHPYFKNIQTSWVKNGRDGAAAFLNSGANDLGGTLMNESITRAAGTEHGQEFDPEEMESLIETMGRQPRMRNTFYKNVRRERQNLAYLAPPLLNQHMYPFESQKSVA